VFLAGLVTFGKPAGRRGPLRRKPLADVVFGDHWGQPAKWIGPGPN
jgi:hypothetical protein